MPKLTHPNGGRIEATDEQAPMYESQGWRTAAAPAARAPRKRAPRKSNAPTQGAR